jgi:hypothetical protein
MSDVIVISKRVIFGFYRFLVGIFLFFFEMAKTRARVCFCFCFLFPYFHNKSFNRKFRWNVISSPRATLMQTTAQSVCAQPEC